MILSFFPNMVSPKGSQRDLSFSEFYARMLTHHVERAEKDGPLFSFCAYPGSEIYRGDARVESVAGLVLDFDNEGETKEVVSDNPTQPEDHESNLNGYAYAWHTSHRHRPEHPKFRMVFPLSRPLARGEFAAAHDGLMALIGRDRNVDSTCGELSRAYYLPSCPPENAGFAKSAIVEGELLTPEILCSAASFPTSQEYAPARRNAPGNAGRNNRLKDIACSMIARGENNETIVVELLVEDAKHTIPLFTDRGEAGYRGDAYTAACLFASNIRRSMNEQQTRAGTEPYRPREVVTITATEVFEPEQPEEIPHVPERLLTVPGMLGEFVSHMVDSAYKQQRSLSVAAALCSGGTIMGQRYSCANTRSNIQICSVAESGEGKENQREAIKHLFAQAGLDDLLGGEEIKSGQAIYSRVALTPVVLFQLDEFGLALKNITSRNAGGWQADILPGLMKMFSSSNSIVKSAEFADQKNNRRITIEYPCVSVHATTTGVTFWPTLSSQHVLSGFLNRFVVVESENPRARRVVPVKRISDIPPIVIKWAKILRSVDGRSDPRGNLIGWAPGSPLAVGRDFRALALYDDFLSDFDAKQSEAESGQKTLCMRAPEYVTKIAQIVAGSLDASNVFVTVEAMEWAILFVTYWMGRLIDNAQKYIADSVGELVEKQILEYLYRCKKSGAMGADILNYCRAYKALEPYKRRAAIESLEYHGQIVVVPTNIGGKGQRGKRFFLPGFGPGQA